MTNNNPKRAEVAMLKIGNIEFSALMFPDGSYGLGVSQLAKIFPNSVSHSNASKYVKRIMGEGFQLVKYSSILNPKKVNTITEEQFLSIIKALAKKGDPHALDLMDELLGLSIKQLFADAFKQKFDAEDRQQWLKSRQQGKIIRRTLTDAIQSWIKRHPNHYSENKKKWIYLNCSDAINRIVFARSAKKLKESWGVQEVREAMTFEELILVGSVERLAITLIDDYDYEPLSAVKEAGNRLLIKAIER